MTAIMQSIAVITAFLLLAGGWHQWRADRKRAVLMLMAALVILVNVWLWTTMPETLPDCALAGAPECR
ncbi:MAG: hypothetical protein WCZ66_05400 [Sphingomonadaceae bacterium]